MKIRILLTLASIHFLIIQLHAQQFEWVKTIGGEESSQDISCLATDQNNNIYASGTFANDTILFMEKEDSIDLYPKGKEDIFIIKMDSAGNDLWMSQFKKNFENYNVSAMSLTVDDSSNVYGLGTFADTIDFKPNDAGGEMYATGLLDIFIFKLDSLGDLVWNKNIGGNNLSLGNSIQVDELGNIIITGTYIDSIDTDPGIGEKFLVSDNGFNAFLLQLDKNGTFQWVHSLESPDDVTVGNIVVGNNTLYLTGTFNDTLNIVEKAGNIEEYYPSDDGDADNFFIKFDENGDIIWFKSLGYDNGTHITCDKDNNLLASGTFSTETDFNPGPENYYLSPYGLNENSDIFVFKLDEDGSFIWARQMGGEDGDYVRDIGVDKNGNVYTTGQFTPLADFDPGDDIYVLPQDHTGSTLSDIFISKMDKAGRFVWAKSIGSTGSDIGGDIEIDTESNIITTGNFYYSVDFDPDEPEEVRDMYGIFANLFILKLKQTNSQSSLNITSCGPFTSPSELHVWDTSGVYQDIIPNSSGGDSIITIHLMINNTEWDTTNVLTCKAYISPSGKYNWTQSGTYQDTLNTIHGCDSILIVELEIMDTTVIQSNSILTALQSEVEYQWIDCSTNSPIDGETYQSFAPEEGGEFAVILSNNGCSVTSSCFTVSSTLDINLPGKQEVALYPNPSNDYIHLNGVQLFETIQIIDMNGRIIQSLNNEETDQVQINLHSIESGVYLIRLEGDEGTIHKRFIKK